MREKICPQEVLNREEWIESDLSYKKIYKNKKQLFEDFGNGTTNL